MRVKVFKFMDFHNGPEWKINLLMRHSNPPHPCFAHLSPELTFVVTSTRLLLTFIYLSVGGENTALSNLDFEGKHFPFGRWTTKCYWIDMLIQKEPQANWLRSGVHTLITANHLCRRSRIGIDHKLIERDKSPEIDWELSPGASVTVGVWADDN